MRKIKNIALSILPLITGGMLYLGYRSPELIMFRWANFLGLSNIVSSWREFCLQHPLPEWFYYALPDGLWLLSYILLVNLTWNELTWKSRIWVYALPTVAIISELMQILIPMLGTFDIIDLTCYIGAIILFELKNITQWKRKGL